MKLSFVSCSTLFLVAFTFGQSGCSSSKNENRSPHGDVPPVAEGLPSSSEVVEVPKQEEEKTGSNSVQRWKLTYTTDCGEIPLTQCQGGFGFEVREDGRYVVGPGPSGQTLSGKLASDELGKLKAFLPDVGVGECGKRGAHLIRGDQSSKPVCSPGLEIAVQELMVRYYPASFPNPCVDAAFTLEQAYQAVQGCEQDSDCSYVDAGLSPVDAFRIADFDSDDCSYVKPLVVANAFGLVVRQRQLVLKREAARDVCSKMKPNERACFPFAVDDRSLPLPLCVRGVCEAPGFLIN